MLRCAITSLGTQTLDSPRERRMRLREQVRRWTINGVDIVQLREKGLESGDLLGLAETALEVLRGVAAASGRPGAPRLLINGRPDVAAAAGADGVHLTAPAGELTPGQVRRIFAVAGLPECFVSVSCHGVVDVAAAREDGADQVLFGPVFEKRVGGEVVVAGVGLDSLRDACAAAGGVPVLALGGVTGENVAKCVRAGAAGIAGIRLFA